MKSTKSLKISIKKQKLYLLAKGKIIKSYSVSTSRFGTGNQYASNKTPLGLHRISNKIGKNALSGDIFKRRRNTHKRARLNYGDDFITTRILRLEGLEKGFNKGKNVDTFRRCIYIHGTPDENLIGKPASGGCIRMKNRDIIELFDSIPRGSLVEVIK
jgi:hypothetical protein